MIKLTAKLSILRQVQADAVAIVLPEEKQVLRRELQNLRKPFGAKIERALELEKFEGKEGEVVSLLTERTIRAPRLLLAGLGKNGYPGILERYRRAAAAAAKRAQASKVRRLAILLPAAIESSEYGAQEIAQALIEGAVLALYKFDRYLTEKENRDVKLQELIVFSPDRGSLDAMKKAVREAGILCEAVTLARDLENAPANEIYPETLAEAARRSARTHGFRAEVWDKRKIERAGFGGLLAVNSGSDKPPRFIILEYNAARRNLETVVLIGKGITFDSGGISIKPASGMSEMKMDMSGAAAVIGTLEAAARLGLPVHIVGLISSTENLLGGSAMKPGDIITHYGGKTSEVDNTDAEGRLILADALAYASRFKPRAVIDLATLTGACVVALGHVVTGMMGNDEKLMGDLTTAGEKTYERVWPLPMFEEYAKQIKSDVADVKNVGGHGGGAITAAFFLKKFIGDYKWAHLDIAGTAILDEALPYAPKGGSGVGVRLLVEFLKNWKSS
ncbi:MAG TPA: leucyl aminopeptidase [Bacteroidota bacterium]|nr:leucyl aminopeptidase [Bacteroidota bacterium]